MGKELAKRNKEVFILHPPPPPSIRQSLFTGSYESSEVITSAYRAHEAKYERVLNWPSTLYAYSSRSANALFYLNLNLTTSNSSKFILY